MPVIDQVVQRQHELVPAPETADDLHRTEHDVSTQPVQCSGHQQLPWGERAVDPHVGHVGGQQPQLPFVVNQHRDRMQLVQSFDQARAEPADAVMSVGARPPGVDEHPHRADSEFVVRKASISRAAANGVS